MRFVARSVLSRALNLFLWIFNLSIPVCTIENVSFLYYLIRVEELIFWSIFFSFFSHQSRFSYVFSRHLHLFSRPVIAPIYPIIRFYDFLWMLVLYLPVFSFRGATVDKRLFSDSDERPIHYPRSFLHTWLVVCLATFSPAEINVDIGMCSFRSSVETLQSTFSVAVVIRNSRIWDDYGATRV